jgi:hypothetical protein
MEKLMPHSSCSELQDCHPFWQSPPSKWSNANSFSCESPSHQQPGNVVFRLSPVLVKENFLPLCRVVLFYLFYY